jgi:hypothetical protein
VCQNASLLSNSLRLSPISLASRSTSYSLSEPKWKRCEPIDTAEKGVVAMVGDIAGEITMLDVAYSLCERLPKNPRECHSYLTQE